MNNKLKLKIIERYGTQSDFAVAIGRSDAIVSRVVRGRIKLSAKARKLWAEALGCCVDHIFVED